MAMLSLTRWIVGKSVNGKDSDDDMTLAQFQNDVKLEALAPRDNLKQPLILRRDDA